MKKITENLPPLRRNLSRFNHTLVATIAQCSAIVRNSRNLENSAMNSRMRRTAKLGQTIPGVADSGRNVDRKRASKRRKTSKVHPQASSAMHPEKLRQSELHQQILSNRARRLANATHSPYSQRPGSQTSGRKVRKHALVASLALVISLTAGSLFDQASEARKIAKDSLASTIAGLAVAGDTLSDLVSR